MSNTLVNAFKEIRATPTQRLVAYMLADSCNEQNNQCNPSVDRLRALTSLSDRAIETAIKGLEAAGHLTVLRRFGARNCYSLHPKTSEPDSSVSQQNQRTCFASERASPANLLPKPANDVPQTSEPPAQTSERRSLKTVETEKKQKKRTSSPDSEADSRHQPFIDAFCTAWKDHHGRKYLFNPRDAREVKQLLQRTDDTVDSMVESAKWCWHVCQTNTFADKCAKEASTITGFCANYNGIIAYMMRYAGNKRPAPKHAAYNAAAETAGKTIQQVTELFPDDNRR